MPDPRRHFTATRAKDVMTDNVVSFDARTRATTAAETLEERGISGAPVVSSEGTCLGVFSTKDLCRLNGTALDSEFVISYMTSPAITVSQDHSLLDVVGILRSSKTRRVPVVDNLGKVVGIVSATDIIEQIAVAMESESATHCV